MASDGAVHATGKRVPALRYVLITPARNEESFIEGTIKSVIAQTALPLKWVIVSDGSTDKTDDIAGRYAREHSWMELLRRPERRDRQFAAKAHAFNAGYARVKDTSYDIIGNLDADITFGADYFQFLMAKFEENPRMGVAGTPFVENFDRPDDHTYAHGNANLNHVSGACQMFRRECFAEIGGYIPVKGGAIDWIAVTTARMKGWQTRTFTETVCYHHRKIGTGTGANDALRTRFHYGKKAYYVGGHPLWELVRGVGQMRQRPYLVGGAAFLGGYLMAGLQRIERPVSPELLAFHRREQMGRLSRVFSRR
jgi:glycosyltransferase involved in cell wall biosynthesis